MSTALALLLAVLCVTLTASGLVLAWLVPDEAMPLPPDLRPRTAALPIAMLSYAAVGTFLAILRPRNPIGWIFCAVALMWSAFVFGSGYTQFAFVNPTLALPAVTATALVTANLWIVAGALIGIGLLLFPDGEPLTPRWRGLPVFIAVAAVVVVSAISLTPGSVPNRSYLPNPLGVSDAGPAIAFLSHQAFVVLWAATYSLAAVSLFLRYRRSDFVHRQQLKWIAFGGAALVVTLLGLQAFAESPFLRTVEPTARNGVALFGALPAALAIAAFPVAAGVAILRHRLYDIDLLIKRTLTYGATSTAIAAVFFLGILALQSLLRPLTAGNELSVATSTLISFALFHPVRRRLQDVVDRRFDRSRYDAARMLDAFADRVRDQVDLESVRGDLVGVVRETLAPTHTSLWLRR